MKKIYLSLVVFSTSLVSGCATNPVNRYDVNYVQHVPREVMNDIKKNKESDVTHFKIERVGPSRFSGPEDFFAHFGRKGYVMIGSSSFTDKGGFFGPKVEDEQNAVTKAVLLDADLVVVFDPNIRENIKEYEVEVPVEERSRIVSNSNLKNNYNQKLGSISGSSEIVTKSTRMEKRYQKSYEIDHNAVFFMKTRFSHGIQSRSMLPDEKSRFETNKGAYVLYVVDGSPAYEADIVSGDVILKIDGETVSDAADLVRLLDARRGSFVELGLLRKERRFNKKLFVNENGVSGSALGK